MKEERLAVLSMIEKGIISVDEAERLLKAMNETAANDRSESVLSKAGENIGSFAKTAAEKAERIIEDAKPVVKKAVDDASPKVKKFGEKATEFTSRIMKKKTENESDVTDSDFVEDVTIIPVESKTEEVTEETDEKE